MIAALAALAIAAPAASAGLSVAPLALPGGGPGIGFDDMRYVAPYGALLVGAGRSGRVDLVYPDTGLVRSAGGFSAATTYGGGHDFGATSADRCGDAIFVTDRTSRRLATIDARTLATVGSIGLSAEPDYVRCLGPGGEVWVTEPDASQIEVFRPPQRVAVIGVPGGPESLVVDPARNHAYANLWSGTTLAIDLSRRTVVARWPNGCRGSRGLALDPGRGLLFVACAEGRAAALDVGTGRVVSVVDAGRGLDIIDVAPALGHLYLPGGKSETLEVAGYDASGHLRPLGSLPTARGAHCVAADGARNAWVCDPWGGRLLRVRDALPSSGP